MKWSIPEQYTSLKSGESCTLEDIILEGTQFLDDMKKFEREIELEKEQGIKHTMVIVHWTRLRESEPQPSMASGHWNPITLKEARYFSENPFIEIGGSWTNYYGTHTIRACEEKQIK